MNKKAFIATIAFLMIPLLMVATVPVKAWDYTDGTSSDTLYETFGPRADKLLIKLYESDTAEFDALATGEIDITDWPLTKPYYDQFTTPPENESIEVFSYGAEFGLFLLDINWNNNTYLGNPPDPAYSNPVFPNPLASVDFRKAIWHLHDKPAWLPEILGEGFYYDVYTVVPPCFGSFHVPMANPYPYDPATAASILDSAGFPWSDDNGNGEMDPGERFWDRNGNGVRDGGEDLVIKFFIRSDHPHRNAMGDKLSDEMNKIGIAVERIYGPVLEAVEYWFYNKEVHLYTAGWGLGVDPDHIILWNSFFYWHPGFCYNTGFVNDEVLDETSWGVYLANTVDEALTNCQEFQYRFAEVAAAVPWFSYSGSKGVYRTYTGGTAGTPQGDDEDIYRGNYWDGMVNVQGYGIDSFFGLLNMHPRGFHRGNGEMTIRYAFKTAELKSFNPVYSEWVWEWAVLGLMYESLLYRNPYDLSDIRPWLAESYEVGVYDHPVYGPCTSVKFTLRPDAYWSDGTPITVADVFFTFVEIDDILIGRGFPPPWWYSSVEPILSFSIIDTYTFEVLLDMKSVYAVMYPGGNVILPKHIWKPIAETHTEPNGPAPDPNSISNGAWRLAEYVPYSHVLMVANAPGSTVTISTPFHEGSEPITSPYGYFRYHELQYETLTIDGTTGRKFADGSHTLELNLMNAYLGGAITADITVDIAGIGTFPFDDVVIAAGDTWTFTDTSTYGFGFAPVTISFNYTDPNGEAVSQIIMIGIWFTIREDIVGSTWYDDLGFGDYPYKQQLTSPDIKVNIRDVSAAAAAFGSYPGHARWSTAADITGDYQVNIRDVAAIAALFGWVG